MPRQAVSIQYDDGSVQAIAAPAPPASPPPPPTPPAAAPKIAYVEPTLPTVERTVTVANTDELAKLIATKPTKIAIELAPGVVYDIGNGWQPGDDTIVRAGKSDATAPAPIIRCLYTGKSNATAMYLKGKNQWVEGLRVQNHPSSTGPVIGFRINGQFNVVNGCFTDPGLLDAVKVSEVAQASDVWILNNDFAQANDYCIYFHGDQGSCTRAYVMSNKFRGVAPGKPNHTIRIYGLNDALFFLNDFGPNGLWQKGVFNVRGCNNVDFFRNIFQGLPNDGSQALIGPLDIEPDEPGTEVRDLRLIDNEFDNLNTFTIHSRTENLLIDGGSIQMLKFDVFSALTTAPRPAPNATIQNVTATGPRDFIRGDQSRITIGAGNVFNGKPVK